MPSSPRLGRPLIIFAAAVGVAGLLAGPTASASTGHHTTVPRVSAPQVGGVTEACPPVPAGHVRCLSEFRTDARLGSGAHPAASPASNPIAYTPANLRAAYHLPSTTGGSGQTVAIVDAYDDPNAESDLATYRSNFGLPACTSASGCFQKVDQTGGTSYPQPDAGWISEESIDMDMVSAVCPNCHIVLVEANSNQTADLAAGVDEAVTLGAAYVSNSWGSAEASENTAFDSHFNHPGVVITVATGDGGYSAGVGWPASTPYVTAVGGTSLKTSSNARGWTESVWNGTQSGCSGVETKPSWQHDTGCAKRTEADVSAVSDPNTGVVMYDSTPPPNESMGGWFIYGGTSVATPIVAAIYALAGTPQTGTNPASYLYAHTNTLNDVGSGNDGSCGSSYLCTAKSGYDGPTGLGTPWGSAPFGASTVASGEVWSWVRGKCLDDHASKTTNGNPIDLYSCNNTAAQHVTVEQNGSIQILGKCLDDYGASQANGAKVDLASCNGTTGQHWSWGPNGELINWHAGRCIDDPASSTKNGVDLILWSCTGTNPESWQLP